MATIKSSDQITITDITDAYSVVLSNESHTFIGDADSALAGTATTNVYAFRGATAMKVTVGEIAGATGISAAVDNNNTTSPLVTFTVTTSLKAGGTLDIPITITDEGVSITKKFTYSIAFQGTSVKVSSKSVTYQTSSSGTTMPTGTWSTTVPATEPGEYLWIKTVVTYSDGNKTEAYSVSRNAAELEVTGTVVEYVASSSGTTKPTTGWDEAIPTVTQGNYLWTKTTVSYSDGSNAVSYSVARHAVDGEDGADGADAITISITTNNGNIFKNSEGTTTLTAHVYQGGVEITDISSLGTLKWYKDGGTTAVATGASLTVDAGDITNKAVYTVQLEA